MSSISPQTPYVPSNTRIPLSATPTLSPTPTTTTRNAVDVPSSTVISIGLGFVAFTFGLIFLLFTLRFFRVYNRMRRDRASGMDIDFRRAWRREGGLFGFITGFAGTGLGTAGLSAGAGGGGWNRLELARIREMYWMDRQGEGDPDGIKGRPMMWESKVEERGMCGAKGEGEKTEDGEKEGIVNAHDVSQGPGRDSSALGLDHILLDWNPLCATTPHPPLKTLPSTSLPSPYILISLLIAMPTEPTDKSASTAARHTDPAAKAANLINAEDDYADLPDVAIGTCHLSPMIPTTCDTAKVVPGSLREKSQVDGPTGPHRHTESKSKTGEVEQYEYAPGAPDVGYVQTLARDSRHDDCADQADRADHREHERGSGMGTGRIEGEGWRPLVWERTGGGEYILERTDWG